MIQNNNNNNSIDDDNLSKLHEILTSKQCQNVRSRAIIEARYHSQIERQSREIHEYLQDCNLLLPVDLNYSQMAWMSTETKEILSKTLPTSLAALKNIPNLSPDVYIRLIRHCKPKVYN